MTLSETVEEIADALRPLAGEIEGLQVYPYFNSNPTPPSIDIYPGAPFQVGAGFRVGSSQVYFTVRARVATVDQQAAMTLLLRLLDPNDLASVEAAIAELDGPAVLEVSEFREYLDDSASDGRLLGCEWRVTAFLEAE